MIPRDRRKGFLRNQRMWHRHLAILRLGSLPIGTIEEEPPALTQGLVPYLVVVDKQRKHPLPTHRKQGGTASCAFKALLDEVPGLRKGLDGAIRDEGSQEVPYTFISVEQLIQDFKADIERLRGEQHE